MGVEKKYSGPRKTSPVTNHYFLINEVIELNISDFREYSCGSISPMFVKKIVWYLAKIWLLVVGHWTYF